LSDREELREVARQLRAHTEWLRLQGIDAVPAVASGAATGAVAPGASPERHEAPKRAAADPRSSRPTAASDASEVVSASPVPSQEIGERRALDVVRDELGECTRCKLHSTRTKIVFGVGNPRADLMFVGEGPGRDEDLQGEPFVGAAGKLLTKIIGAMGMAREDVYIANVVKCRPPLNRDPEVDEVAACSPFLFQQIASIRPKVIVSLGRPACATLIGAPLTTPISKLRGKWLEYRGGIPIMPTFHPAYLLRSPSAKREVWEDMKAVVARLESLTGRTFALGGGA
jgi:DNA polymerase